MIARFDGEGLEEADGTGDVGYQEYEVPESATPAIENLPAPPADTRPAAQPARRRRRRPSRPSAAACRSAWSPGSSPSACCARRALRRRVAALTPPLGAAAPPPRPLGVRLGWIGALAFASGFPFGLVNETIPIYLRTIGASLEQVADVTAITLPWSLKFVWAPAVDRLGRRRHWITSCLALARCRSRWRWRRWTRGDIGPGFWVLLLLMVTLSATQDVAIDAYTIESMEHARARRREFGADHRATAWRCSPPAAR